MKLMAKKKSTISPVPAEALLHDRRLFLTSTVDEETVSRTIKHMMFLELQAPHEDIRLYINSPGGEVSGCLAIYDVIQNLSCDVATVCLGEACSAAAVLLAAGTKGKRLMFTNARVMLHNLSGGISGTLDDILVYVEECKAHQEILNKVLAKHTHQKLSKIREDLTRDKWMSSKQAKEYGIVDFIITNNKTLK